MLTDSSLMPWGKYKGEAMTNIPADYLIWLWDNEKCSGDVKDYIKRNLENLKMEIKNEAKKKN